MPKRKTLTEVKTEIETSGEYVLLSDEYVNNMTKLLVKHNTCGEAFETNYQRFAAGCRCPNCYGNKKKGIESVKEEIESVPNYKLLTTEYINNKQKLDILHESCGNVYKSDINNFHRGCRCPYCFGTKKKTVVPFNAENRDVINELHCPNYAKAEDSLASYIKSLGFSIIENYIPEGFDTYGLNILIKELNIGIEFDGIYGNSTKFKDPKYHIDKMKFYNRKGIRIINVFEDEWLDKPDLVKRKLSHILGKDTSNKVYGRKCIAKKINSNDEKDEFLLRNHIQGTDKSTYKYGLYYNSELVAVMTFGVPRAALGKSKHENKEFELVRYATSCNVIGGFGKLLKFAINDLHIKKILTYADLRYSTLENNIYEKNGFKLDHISNPNYFYIKNGKRYHRFNFNKMRLKKLYPEQYSDSKTEFQMTEDVGLYRIYDCGNAVYVLEI